MKIIKEREYVEDFNYFIEYESIDEPGCGFWFECDKDRNILKEELENAGLENLAKCILREHKVKPGRFREIDNSYWEPAQGICNVCGEVVYLYSGWANDCEKCGTEYNGSGQMLASRDQWGEETGERF